MKKLISIIWGYPEHLNSFSPEENVHLHPLDVAKKLGYDVIIFTDNARNVKSCEYFDKSISLEEFSGFFNYIIFLFKNKNSIFYVNSYEWKSFLVPFICRKSIFMGHTHVMRKTKIKQLIQRFVFKFFYRIRLNNNDEREYLIKTDNIDEKKLFVIPLPVSSKSFYFIDNIDRNNIVYFGNVTKKKNLETILRSLRIVVDQYKDVKLDIIGNMWNDDIAPLISNLKLENNVNIIGFIEQSKVSSKLNNYLISVNSSLDEGQCVAVYDTALCGCALCLPNIMSFKGVFKDKSFFHDVYDFNKLANNIIEYISNKQLCKEKNSECRDMILKEYDSKIVEEKLFLLFDIN